MRVLFEYQRTRTADDPDSKPHPGGMVWIQRFSDGGGAWFHLHILLPDGVFRAPKHALGAAFEPLPPPTQAEVDALLGECDGFQVHAATSVPPDSPEQVWPAAP